MVTVLIRVVVDAGAAEFELQKARLRLADDEVDARFGLCRIDPAHGVYAMKIRFDVLERTLALPGVSGPFSSPGIKVETT